MTDVSIVIAAWKAEGFIAQAIADALAQQGVTLEVVVVDDASPDGTETVVKSILDPRVRYIRLPQNGGPGAARNAGFDAAVGEWLMVLDADDRIEPDRAASLIGAARAEGADIVADNFQIVAADTDAPPRLHIDEVLDGSTEQVSLEVYVRENHLFGRRPPYGYLKPLFRRAFLKSYGLDYDTGLRVGEDYDLVARMLVLGASFVRQRSAGYTYVTHAGSISHRLSAANAWAMVAAEERFQAAAPNPNPGLRALLARRLAGLKDGAAFSDMVEAVKGRDLGRLAKALASRPQAARHFAMPIAARVEKLQARLQGPATSR